MTILCLNLMHQQINREDQTLVTLASYVHTVAINQVQQPLTELLGICVEYQCEQHLEHANQKELLAHITFVFDHMQKHFAGTCLTVEHGDAQR